MQPLKIQPLTNSSVSMTHGSLVTIGALTHGALVTIGAFGLIQPCFVAASRDDRALSSLDQVTAIV